MTKTRSELADLLLISSIKSSIWSFVGLISTRGSSNPVGLTSCSAICEEIFFSYSEGVAETKIVYFECIVQILQILEDDYQMH